MTLEAGRDHYAAAWPGVPAAEGLDTAGMLQAAVDGRVRALVLVGADPLGDFPDADLARRALGAVDTIIATDTHLTASSALAHVVLPAAGFAEVAGTTTNLEGRVSVLGQRVTPPGTARSDWILAADLASALGADLGFDSEAAVWDEIERLAPAHAGLTAEVLAGPGGADGTVVPLAGATPAVPLVTFTPPVAQPSGGNDAYALRLVSTRRLYDEGVAVQHSPGLAGLAPGATLRLHPADLERLGVADGGTVQVTSSRTTLRVPVSVDASLPRGSAGVWFNQPGVNAAELIDASEPVTLVQVASVDGGAGQ